jgi:hypothetical protein
MGRARRLVTPDGNLYCIACQSWVHIKLWSTSRVFDDSDPADIWYVDPDTHRQYGKPSGYCRKCYSRRTQGSAAFRKYQIGLGLNLAKLKTRFEAEDEYLDSQPKAPVEMSSAEVDAENERLRRKYPDLFD